MKLIGFASQYYTLWNVEEETIYQADAYGKQWPSNHITKYFYIKNVSMDIEKVKSLYPDLAIDESLKGQYRDFQVSKRLPGLPINFFNFGKYSGHSIEEVAELDFPYLLWCLNDYCGSADFREKVKELPKIVEHFAEIKRRQEMEIAERMSEIKPLESGVYRLLVESNPREKQVWVQISEFHNVVLQFDEVENLNYNGFWYEVPVFNNKIKRIKNKELAYNLEILSSEILPEGICNQVARVISIEK